MQRTNGRLSQREIDSHVTAAAAACESRRQPRQPSSTSRVVDATVWTLARSLDWHRTCGVWASSLRPNCGAVSPAEKTACRALAQITLERGAGGVACPPLVHTASPAGGRPVQYTKQSYLALSATATDVAASLSVRLDTCGRHATPRQPPPPPPCHADINQFESNYADDSWCWSTAVVDAPVCPRRRRRRPTAFSQALACSL